MNLEQFEPEVQERIREHMSSYSTGRLIPAEDGSDDPPKEILYIYAETRKEAQAIVETATLLNHYSEFIPRCGCAHDCCAHVSTSYRELTRLDEWHFIAIHSFTINV